MQPVRSIQEVFKETPNQLLHHTGVTPWTTNQKGHRTSRAGPRTCHGFPGSLGGLCAACPPLVVVLVLALPPSLGRLTPLPVSLIRIPRGPPHSAASGAGAVAPARAASLASLSSLSCLGSRPHSLVSDTRVMSTVRHSYLSSGHASATPGEKARGSPRVG